MSREQLEVHVNRVVDDAPPLTDQQTQRLVALLRPTAHEGAA